MSMKIKPKIRVDEVMLSLDKTPLAKEGVMLKEALDIMDRFKLGIVCVVDKDLKLIGVITDGDIRRTLLTIQKPLSSILVDDLKNYYIINPITINYDSTLISSIDLMGEKQIWDLPVTDKSNSLLGLLHLHSAISAVLKG